MRILDLLGAIGASDYVRDSDRHFRRDAGAGFHGYGDVGAGASAGVGGAGVGVGGVGVRIP